MKRDLRLSSENLMVLLLSSVIFCLMITPSFATQFYQGVNINGTGTVHNIIQTDTMITEQVVEIDGLLYFNLVFDDGTSKLVELEKYIKEKESDWSHDDEGMSLDDLTKLFYKLAKNKTGDDTSLSENEEALLEYLDVIIQANIYEFFNQEVMPLSEVLSQQGSAIQSNIYETEALYRTLEKDEDIKDTYCRSRMEIVKKYGLSSVKCGLHSKQCYNGDIYRQENGRDFCIYTDNDKEYIPCYNTFGRCGSLDYLEVFDGEENSYLALKLTYTNPGAITLSPTLKIEIEDPSTYEQLKSYEYELGELAEGEGKDYVFYIDNSGLKPGLYNIRVTLNSGRKELLDEFQVRILPEGFYEREGILNLEYTVSKLGEPMEIKGTYTNTAENSYSVSMIIDIVYNGLEAERLRSDRISFKPGEQGEFIVVFTPEKSGNYKLIARISDSELEIFDEFYIDKLSMTGHFVNIMKQVPLGQAIAEKINASENSAPFLMMSFAVSALVLLPCFFIRALLSGKNKRRAELDYSLAKEDFDEMDYTVENEE